MAGIFPDILPLPSAPAGKQWQENSSSIGDAAGGFPTGQRSCLTPREAPSHLAPDFNTLPRELSRPFPSLGLKEGKVFFSSSSAADTKLQWNRKATFLFFCTGTEQEKGTDFVLGSATGYAWKVPRKGAFQAQQADLPRKSKQSSPLEHSSSPSPGCTTSFKGASPARFKHYSIVQKTLRLHHNLWAKSWGCVSSERETLNL